MSVQSAQSAVVRATVPWSLTPVEDSMRAKLIDGLKPTTIEVCNDSSEHSHHKAMKDSVSQETHFRLVITSIAFRHKVQPARHRMIYALLKEELKREGGIHALQLRTQTPEEEKERTSRERIREEAQSQLRLVDWKTAALSDINSIDNGSVDPLLRR